MLMKKAEFQGAVRLGATLAVAGALLSGSNQDVYAGVPLAGWCDGTQTEHVDSLRTPTDQLTLPPLPAEFDHRMPEIGVLTLGSISVQGSTVTLEKTANVPEMPKAHECALRYAVDDPFVRSTMQEGVGISVFATDSGKFPGVFTANQSSADPEQTPGSVLLSLATRSADSIFFTSWGETRVLLMHEMGHAWARRAELRAEVGDTRLSQLLDNVTAAYVAQAGQAMEQIRRPLAAIAAPVLTHIETTLRNRGSATDAAVIKSVLSALEGTASPALLSEISCDENGTGLNKCRQQFINDMVVNLARKQEHTLSDAAWELLDPRQNPAVLAVNKQHVALLENNSLFPMSDASSAIPGSQGGHPYTSANEKSVDELVISNVLGVDATVARIDALPASQRQATIASYIAVAELYDYVFSPAARDATVIDQVAARLRALPPPK